MKTSFRLGNICGNRSQYFSSFPIMSRSYHLKVVYLPSLFVLLNTSDGDVRLAFVKLVLREGFKY